MPVKTIPILLLLFLLTACGAPAAEIPPPASAATNLPEDLPESVAANPETEPEVQVADAMPQSEPVYRGEDLVATDPSLLNFESGRPQLVEFFRFT